jgi:hypothetical protein
VTLYRTLPPLLCRLLAPCRSSWWAQLCVSPSRMQPSRGASQTSGQQRQQQQPQASGGQAAASLAAGPWLLAPPGPPQQQQQQQGQQVLGTMTRQMQQHLAAGHPLPAASAGPPAGPEAWLAALQAVALWLVGAWRGLWQPPHAVSPLASPPVAVVGAACPGQQQQAAGRGLPQGAAVAQQQQLLLEQPLHSRCLLHARQQPSHPPASCG